MAVVILSLLAFTAFGGLLNAQQTFKGCSKYSCGTLNGNSCASSSAGSNTITVSPCSQSNSSKAYCPAQTFSNVDMSAECTEAPEPVYHNLNIMDPCGSSNQCKGSLTCDNGACNGFDEGDDCQYDYECNPGTYCKSTTFKCAKQLAIGDSGCEWDTDCVNNAVCKHGSASRLDGSDLLNGKCIAIHSLQDGEDPGMCGTVHFGGFGHINAGCANFACATVDVIQNRHICLPLWTTKTQGACVNHSDCAATSTYKTNTFSYTEEDACKCGANTNGTAYCKQHIGDAVSKPLTDLIKKTEASPKLLTQCNTHARFSLNCKRRVLSNDDFNAFVTAKLNEQNYANIYNTEDCLIQVYAYKYWYYKQDPEPPAPPAPDYDDDVDDDASDMGIVIALLGLFYLI